MNKQNKALLRSITNSNDDFEQGLINNLCEIIREMNQQYSGEEPGLPVGATLSTYIKARERDFIRETLKVYNGNRERTADVLGISIATMYRKLQGWK